MAYGYSIPQRIDQAELLDLGVGTPDEVARCMADLWRINRYLGGIDGILRYLLPRLHARQTRLDAPPSTILDLGTGAGQIAAAVAERAKAQTLAVRVIGLDFSARNLAYARQHLSPQTRNPVSLMQADANDLPFAPGTVDYVMSSLFLHHFTPDQVIALLRRAYGAARHGIVMNDLVRGWLPYYAFKLAQPFFARSYLTRHDGALSVRRAYTPAELLAMAHAADIPNPQVHTYFPWRMTLVADKAVN